MTDHTRDNLEDDAFNKVSRRYLIRNSSIAAAGMFIMPTFIPRCRKYDWPTDDGSEPINLPAAAANLANLRAYLDDLYTSTIEYENAVFLALESTNNSDWSNFDSDILIDLFYALLIAAALATGGEAAIPAIAILSAFLHDWANGDKPKPPNIDQVFAQFEFGHNQMHVAMNEQLTLLESPANNYANLVAAWNNPIQFNGNTYTIGDLASSNFPTSTTGGAAYNAIYQAGVTSFQQMLWNLAIMKCCTFGEPDTESIYTASEPGGVLLTHFRQTVYPNNKGVYYRAKMTDYDPPWIYWDITKYTLGINGNPLPDAAAAVLFIDDTPGNVINSQGLFNRSYVFEQFSFTKPVFPFGDELGTDAIGNTNPAANDWNFTGGQFPGLVVI
ncbi:hypothetical protein [Pollutibacter soli]|uniref:hypothetical protein n=1 Tax=Pollutibacter soli TaxID=3034157 RepID=UPI003013F179